MTRGIEIGEGEAQAVFLIGTEPAAGQRQEAVVDSQGAGHIHHTPATQRMADVGEVGSSACQLPDKIVAGEGACQRLGRSAMTLALSRRHALR